MDSDPLGQHNHARCIKFQDIEKYPAGRENAGRRVAGCKAAAAVKDHIFPTSKFLDMPPFPRSSE